VGLDAKAIEFDIVLPIDAGWHILGRYGAARRDLITQTPPPAFPVLLPVLPPGRYSTTATSSISTIASGWARRLIWIVVLVGVATPR
jgi:hypothetical protein